MSDDPRGPYAPKWTYRRLIVFFGVPYCLLSNTALAFWGPDTDVAKAVAILHGSVCFLLITYYLIGPSWEGVQLTRWNK